MRCGNVTIGMSRNESRAALRNVSDASKQYVSSVINSTLSFINATGAEVESLSNKTKQQNKTEESDVKDAMNKLANISEASAQQISNATVSLAERIMTMVKRAVRKEERVGGS